MQLLHKSSFRRIHVLGSFNVRTTNVQKSPNQIGKRLFSTYDGHLPYSGPRTFFRILLVRHGEAISNKDKVRVSCHQFICLILIIF